MNPKMLGKGVEVDLTAIRWPFRRLDVDASFVSGACRAVPFFPAAGSACRYRSQQIGALLRVNDSQKSSDCPVVACTRSRMFGRGAQRDNFP
jgi:hypothetical protein